MLSSNMNFNKRKTVVQNKKNLISNIDMEICSNRNINMGVAYHKKCSKSQLFVAPLQVHASFKMNSMKSTDKRQHQYYNTYRWLKSTF